MKTIASILSATLLLVPLAAGVPLSIRHDADAGTISVFRSGEDKPILTQNAREDYRPYIHPIVAPDGNGVLTEYQPAHHPHQTGLYWGFTNVNGRDYFHKPGDTHWKRIGAIVLKPESTPTDQNVKWQTVYDLLDEDGGSVLRETQVWSMREQDGRYILDLEWKGQAFKDVTIGEYDYGGMFLRMPWEVGTDARVFTSARDADQKAEGKRAVWVDLGMQVEGREDQAHIAIFDHPSNEGFPQPWRVDKGFGIGPVRARLGDWKIEAGETETIRHQLQVYTDAFNDKSVNDQWAAFTGRESGEIYEQWRLAAREGFEAEFLTPDKALEAMTVKDGFEAQVFASEPMITQPMAFCWDDRGRLWIAENRDYAGRGAGSTFSGESSISILEDTDRDGVADTKKVFLDSVLNPSAMAVGLDGLWLGAIPDLLFVPDRDGDDRADEDDIEVRLTGWGNRDMHEILNSLHWGPDGWLYGLQGVFTPSTVGRPAGANAKYVSPGDRKPLPKKKNLKGLAAEKGEPVAGKTLTTGKGDDKETTWSFSEDGKIRISEGTTGTYTQTGALIIVETDEWGVEMTYDGKTLEFVFESEESDESFEYAEEPTEINGGVWRYHPTKDRFEVVAHGVSNPWGIDYDAKGQIFISACVIPHLWHVVQGGLYHRQAGSHFNPNAYSDIRTIGDHRHRSAHGGARVYLSDAYPPEYHGRLFMLNIHEHALLTDILEPSGSGFIGRHGDDFAMANNAQFVGFSTEIGPDGAVYMLDWHDADICGGGVRTKDTGRVFRIAPEVSNAKEWDGRYGDLNTFDDDKLIQLQLATSAWHARRARVILQNRSIKGTLEDGTHAALRDMFDTNTNGDHRLRALWALHITNGIDQDELTAALSDNDEYVRAWAIQLLCEDMSPPEAARDQFAKLAENDDSPVVRLYLASALQRMDLKHRWPIAEHLVKHGEDTDDHNIPKMLWYGIEPLVPEDPKRALKMADQSQIPLITQYVARRLTAEGDLDPLIDEIDRSSKSRGLLLVGMRDGLEGTNDPEAPDQWAKVYAKLRAEDDETSTIALELSLLFGDAIAAEALLETLQNDENDLDDRRQALRGLAEQKRPELESELTALLDDEALRRDAIRAVASYDNDALAKTLLDRYANYSAEEKLEIVHALSSRPEHGTQLMNAIESEAVPRRDIPPYIARLLFRVVGNRFLAVWGPIEEGSPDTSAAFAKYTALLTDDRIAKADPRRGRERFEQTCTACHQLYGEGGLVGPDLTGANRTDVNYLLENILTPSEFVQDDYKMTMVFTEDGQVHSGVVVGEDKRQLTLRIANVDEPVTIPHSQITDQELTELSMMPEGLLDGLSDDEIADLFAYLRSLEQVSMQDAAN
jgi:putative membrane-bound dehydrogenase-like protein